MVETSFSSNLCKLFSLWPVGVAHTGTEHELCLELQFSSFREPAYGWLCRITLPLLPCHSLVSAATGQSCSCGSAMNHDLLCAYSFPLLTQPRAWEYQPWNYCMSAA